MWRKSSFSGGGDASGGNCVEVALSRTGQLDVRDSKHPVAVLRVNKDLIAWLKGC